MAEVPAWYQVIRTYHPSTNPNETWAVVRAPGSHEGQEEIIILESPAKSDDGKRGYTTEHTSWLFQFRFAAEKEFQALKLVFPHGIAVLKPIS